MAGVERYTAEQFIDAIPGTGGIMSALADKVGCNWETAKKYVHNYATVQRAWQAERARITDRAKHNIVVSIEKGDLAMSKWWLQVMDPEFMPTERHQLTGEDGGPVQVNDEGHNRALLSLADALGAIVSDAGAESKGDMDATE